MSCNPEELKHVPLFALLDEEELAVLATQVEIRNFAARQRIFKIGDQSKQAYVVMSGTVRVTTVDEDQQEVLVDEPAHGGFFGFASMLDETPHQANAMATEDTVCLELDRNDIATLLQRASPWPAWICSPSSAASSMPRRDSFNCAPLATTTKSSKRKRPSANASPTPSPASADRGTSSSPLRVVLVVYSSLNIVLQGRAWDPYPFILLNLFLSMLASIQAPVIMMSQNRQDTKDRLRSELDFDVNRRAETEIQALSHKLNLLTDKVGDVEDLLRSKQSPANS